MQFTHRYNSAAKTFTRSDAPMIRLASIISRSFAGCCIHNGHRTAGSSETSTIEMRDSFGSSVRVRGISRKSQSGRNPCHDDSMNPAAQDQPAVVLQSYPEDY